MKLLYFAWVRQRTGVSEEEFTPAEPVRNVAQLMDALRARGGGFAEAFSDPRRLRCAVNQTHVGPEAALQPGDEVAFFPPVTGG